MKIVHIITRLILGGAQENTLITCKELAARGHEVVLITGPAIGPEGAMFEATKGQGYEVRVCEEMRRAILPWHDVVTYKKLKGMIAQLKPDVVHTHSAKAGILGRVAGYNLKGKFGVARRPAVVHTIHGLAFHPYQNAIVNKLYIAIERFAAKRTDAFITVADAMTRQALAAGMGTADMYTTAYSAIEEESFLRAISEDEREGFRKKYGIASDAVVLVTVSRIAELKGHDYIIESARELAGRFPKAVWLFVGDGALTEQYKEQIRRLGLEERFKFTGLLEPGAVPLAIQSSDVLVHCSLREGLARALPQALLCGTPAISFDVDGAREVVNDNTGRLISPKDIKTLTAACAELIENKELREKLGTAGRESVRKQFAPQTMVDVIEEVYRKVTSYGLRVTR
ncbi:MAG: hypothetical protein A2Y12_04005 [Planctomycetes bacterium GWF2_42_9]|nr:MAG: hypothetical protein A2Y12_04005 [Planctomycetes bacterium GWF2_42_9]